MDSYGLCRTTGYKWLAKVRGRGRGIHCLVARQWVGTFVQWYNHEHRHSTIRFVTPAQRHGGLDTALLEKRTAVYEAAKRKHPARWSGATRNWQPIHVVHLNPDQHITEESKKMEGDIGLQMAA